MLVYVHEYTFLVVYRVQKSEQSVILHPSLPTTF